MTHAATGDGEPRDHLDTQVHNSPRIADKEITFLRDRLSWETEWGLEPNDKTGIGLILSARPENSSPRRGVLRARRGNLAAVGRSGRIADSSYALILSSSGQV